MKDSHYLTRGSSRSMAMPCLSECPQSPSDSSPLPVCWVNFIFSEFYWSPKARAVLQFWGKHAVSSDASWHLKWGCLCTADGPQVPGAPDCCVICNILEVTSKPPYAWQQQNYFHKLQPLLQDPLRGLGEAVRWPRGSVFYMGTGYCCL